MTIDTEQAGLLRGVAIPLIKTGTLLAGIYGGTVRFSNTIVREIGAGQSYLNSTVFPWAQKLPGPSLLQLAGRKADITACTHLLKVPYGALAVLGLLFAAPVALSVIKSVRLMGKSCLQHRTNSHTLIQEASTAQLAAKKEVLDQRADTLRERAADQFAEANKDTETRVWLTTFLAPWVLLPQLSDIAGTLAPGSDATALAIPAAMALGAAVTVLYAGTVNFNKWMLRSAARNTNNQYLAFQSMTDDTRQFITVSSFVRLLKSIEIGTSTAATQTEATPPKAAEAVMPLPQQPVNEPQPEQPRTTPVLSERPSSVHCALNEKDLLALSGQN